MNFAEIEALAHLVLRDATIPELPNHYSGKVRDNYDLADGSRILISTDRISAFDIILACIPLKGQVLTQTAKFWFEATADICPNHVIAYPDPNVVVGKRLDILPVEIVVRDYLAGTTGTSILTMYRNGQRSMYGAVLPDGMRDNQRLPAPIITPTTKAFDGGHDAPLTSDEILAQGLLTAAQWTQLQDHAFALFARGQRLAADRLGRPLDVGRGASAAPGEPGGRQQQRAVHQVGQRPQEDRVTHGRLRAVRRAAGGCAPGPRARSRRA